MQIIFRRDGIFISELENVDFGKFLILKKYSPQCARKNRMAKDAILAKNF